MRMKRYSTHPGGQHQTIAAGVFNRVANLQLQYREYTFEPTFTPHELLNFCRSPKVDKSLPGPVAWRMMFGSELLSASSMTATTDFTETFSGNPRSDRSSGVAWRRGFSLVLMVNTLGLNGDLYMNLEKRLLSVNEVASSLGIGPTTVRYHLQARHWPGVRFGKRGVWRIPAEVLFALQNGIDPKRLRKDAESLLGLDSR